MRVIRLGSEWEPALEEVLEREPQLNLFLLGCLSQHPMNRSRWFATVDGDEILSVVLLAPGKLAVPYLNTRDAGRELGSFLARRGYRPTMTVGPRAACDALWSTWSGGRRTRCYYNQRLYLCSQLPKHGQDLPGFRRAVEKEWRTISVNAASMQLEDLGSNPYDEDAMGHEASVIDRIRQGRTWVLERNGEVLFQINVGTVTSDGCQVGGTYVAKQHRGQGHATRAMQALLHRLVPTYGCVTLHVNEANTTAVRLYERTGFLAGAPMRLIALEHP